LAKSRPGYPKEVLAVLLGGARVTHAAGEARLGYRGFDRPV